MSLEQTDSRVPKKGRIWLAAIAGAFFGVLIGMGAATVGADSDDRIVPQYLFTVRVFGLAVHRELLTPDPALPETDGADWRGPIWGLSITAAFACTGALLGTGAAQYRTRSAKRSLSELPNGAVP